MNFDFDNRKVLVTGAAGGIGKAIVRMFLTQGARVALMDFRADVLESVRHGVGMQERTIGIVADVSDQDSVHNALDAAWHAFGRLDTLVNAAGLYPSKPVLDMSEEDWDTVLDTNLKGPFLVSRGFARRLVEQRSPGHIVNITSGAALRARPGAAHYCTSKAGLEMLTKAMALELAPHHIHVNAVSPGYVEVGSEINALSKNYVQVISSTIPWGRVGHPADIAQAVAFLCSDAAEWITGASLQVDGGSGAGNPSLPLSNVDVE